MITVKQQPEKMYTRGEVAKLTDVGIETVRFYEQEGLIPKPRRSDAGYRQYPSDAIKRIRFIKHTKDLGFSLKEIADLLTLRVNPHCRSHDVKKATEQKINEVDEKIRGLHKMKKALRKLADSCHGKGPTSECPILEALY